MLGDDGRERASLAADQQTLGRLFHPGRTSERIEDMGGILHPCAQRFSRTDGFESFSQSFPRAFDQLTALFGRQSPFDCVEKSDKRSIGSLGQQLSRAGGKLVKLVRATGAGLRAPASDEPLSFQGKEMGAD